MMKKTKLDILIFRKRRWHQRLFINSLLIFLCNIKGMHNTSYYSYSHVNCIIDDKVALVLECFGFGGLFARKTKPCSSLCRYAFIFLISCIFLLHTHCWWIIIICTLPLFFNEAIIFHYDQHTFNLHFIVVLNIKYCKMILGMETSPPMAIPPSTPPTSSSSWTREDDWLNGISSPLKPHIKGRNGQ